MNYPKGIRRDKNHNNQGITLVEVIISLLIIMIVFVPLINSFISASSMTSRAKSQMYASDLANNVMEMVKTLGIEGTALQFNGERDDFLIGTGTGITYEEDLSVASGSSVKLNADGDKVFDSSRKANPYIYKMEGVQEGTREYDVAITFSSSNYTTTATLGEGTPEPTSIPLPNDYSFADLSAFNATTTALINSMSGRTDYDYLAKTYYRQLHESYYYDEWLAECEVINNENDAIYRAYEEACDAADAAGTARPPFPVVQPLPVPKSTLSAESLNSRIMKVTTIELSKVTDSLGMNPKYNLNSYVTYSFDNIMNQGTGIKGICADPATAVMTRNYSGYCDNVKSDSLDSVFLMYTPFISASDLTHEKIVIKNLVAEDFDIYLVVQAPVGTAFTSDLQVELSGTANILKLHSQAKVNISGTGNATNTNSDNPDNRLLNELSLDKARIYDVTIDVYKHGTGFTERLQSISSTVISE